MAVKQLIFPQGTTGQTFFATVRRRTDLFWRNAADGSFAANPANKKEPLTESLVEAGLYEGFINDLPWNDGDYDVYAVTAANVVVGSGYLPIKDDAEVTLTSQHAIIFGGTIVTAPNDTIRQQIMTVLDARLKSILTTNGYKTNIGTHVFPWKSTGLAEAELPAIVYRDSQNEPMEGGPIGKFRWGLTIEIDIVTSGTTSLADMRDMLQDLHSCISTDRKWQDLANSTEQPSDSIEIEQKDKLVAGASLKLKIIYDSPLWEL